MVNSVVLQQLKKGIRKGIDFTCMFPFFFFFFFFLLHIPSCNKDTSSFSPRAFSAGKHKRALAKHWRIDSNVCKAVNQL